jgi:predicted metalloprotease with PDZ domain
MQTDRFPKLCRFGVFLLVFASCTASFGQCSFPTSSAATVLTYSFEPVITGNTMAIRVELNLNGGPGGTLELELPSTWAGQQHAEKAITELRALSPATTIIDTGSPSEKEVRFPPNAAIRISYVLAKDWDGPLNSGTRFRADLTPAYFHLIGTTSLVHPKLAYTSPVDARFDWQKLPVGWSLATSFGSEDRCQAFQGMWRQVVNALFVGGDYRIYGRKTAGGTLSVAIRGKWSFSDDEWICQVQRIIEFERGFWHDNNFPYFLVTVTPLDQDTGSRGGTALTNAFMMHLSRKEQLTPDTLGTLAHETFHTWNPEKMGFRPGSDYAVSWFFEGFTVYYQDLMLLRAGLMTFHDYVAHVNAMIERYETSEGTGVSLQEFIRRHSAEYSDLNRLDGRRGAVLALWLDATIRQRSHNRLTLDNVMFDLVREQAAYEHLHGGQPMALTDQRIFGAVSKYIASDSMNMFRRYVEQGGSIPVPQNALGSCVTSRSDRMAPFDAGFDTVPLRSGAKVVSGVEPDSEAYKAGLRNGQELAAWSIHDGDASKQIRLKIKSAEGVRVLEYYPAGRKVSVQQFSVDAERYSSTPQVCATALRAMSPSD